MNKQQCNFMFWLPMILIWTTYIIWATYTSGVVWIFGLGIGTIILIIWERYWMKKMITTKQKEDLK